MGDWGTPGLCFTTLPCGGCLPLGFPPCPLIVGEGKNTNRIKFLFLRCSLLLPVALYCSVFSGKLGEKTVATK
jgi:hypothetical protein